MVRVREIERALSALDRELGEPPRSARGAVSLVLRDPRGGPEVLLIERAEREGDLWSGQIAFPGGKRKGRDRTLADTARRETKEEVGVSLSRGSRTLGFLPPRYPANRVGWLVVPFVFAVHGSPKLVPGEEAARAFWARLDDLPGGMHRAAIELPDGDELETPAFDVEGKPLWGFTFRVLCDLFDLVGWPTGPGRRD